MDEYEARDRQMEQLINKRKVSSFKEGVWNYAKEVEKGHRIEPHKYTQSFKRRAGVNFLQDIKSITFDDKLHSDDAKIFTEWTISPIAQRSHQTPSYIPSRSYITQKKMDQSQYDQFYGQLELEGNVQAKSNELHYNTYHFNLRTNAISFYSSASVEAGERSLFKIILEENTLDYLSATRQYMLLKGEKNIKILRNQASQQLLKVLEGKLLFFAFRGAYALRNEAPSWRVQEYLLGEIDLLGPINFHNENHIKDIIRSEYYRQTIGAFFALLQRHAGTRNNQGAEITIPRWLKEQFRELPLVNTWLAANLPPPQAPLMTLKVKVNNNEKEALVHSLKYVFPYMRTGIKRSINIYQSQLSDEEMRRVLNNISYPFFSISFPSNNISENGLIYAIQKSSDFHNEFLDLSYNTKLGEVRGAKIFSLLNNNPTIKKISLKGCSVVEGDQSIFFHALKNNLSLLQLQMAYSQTYNDSLVQFLDDFQAVIE